VKPTIYVVEDDPDISRLVRHHLEGASFNVRLYSTGNLVVVDAERQRPSLFLLDIMVPGKDGLELCRQIRQSVALASVPGVEVLGYVPDLQPLYAQTRISIAPLRLTTSEFERMRLGGQR